MQNKYAHKLRSAYRRSGSSPGPVDIANWAQSLDVASAHDIRHVVLGHPQLTSPAMSYLAGMVKASEDGQIQVACLDDITDIGRHITDTDKITTTQDAEARLRHAIDMLVSLRKQFPGSRLAEKIALVLEGKGAFASDDLYVHAMKQAELLDGFGKVDLLKTLAVPHRSQPIWTDAIKRLEECASTTLDRKLSMYASGVLGLQVAGHGPLAGRAIEALKNANTDQAVNVLRILFTSSLLHRLEVLDALSGMDNTAADYEMGSLIEQYGLSEPTLLVKGLEAAYANVLMIETGKVEPENTRLVSFTMHTLSVLKCNRNPHALGGLYETADSVARDRINKALDVLMPALARHGQFAMRVELREPLRQLAAARDEWDRFELEAGLNEEPPAPAAGAPNTPSLS